MDFANLTPELQERVKECKALEDIQAPAEAEGIELSGEELEGMSGGLEAGAQSGDLFGQGIVGSCRLG